MSFGARLRKARRERKLTQEQVAEKLGMDFSSISKWENDKAKPSQDNLVTLAELYDVDVRFLLDVDTEPNDTFDGLDPELVEALKRATPDQQEQFRNYFEGHADAPVRYTEVESRLLKEVEYITPEDLKERYALKVGERMATPDEIEEAIAFIRAKRIMKAME